MGFFSMVAQTIVSSLMEREMERANIQTLDFLPRILQGMPWTQALCYGHNVSAPDSALSFPGKMCRWGTGFLESFFLEHLIKIRLSALFSSCPSS